MPNSSAFDQFCGGPFWNESLTWNTHNTPPDFTPCFQNSVIVWVPCGVLWLLFPFYLCYIKKRETIPNNKMNLMKTALALLIAVVAIIDIIKTWSDYSTPDAEQPGHIYFVSPGIRAATMILATIVIQVDRRYGRYNNGVLFIFWLLQLVASIVPLYSNILRAYSQPDHVVRYEDEFRFATFCVYFALVFLSFILSCFADLPSGIDLSGNPSPEVYASFLNHITFWWLNKLVLTGYKKPLEDQDVFELNPRDISKNSAPYFQSVWTTKLDVYRKEKQQRQKYSKRFDVQNGTTSQNYHHNANEKTPLLKDPVKLEPHVEVKSKEPKKKKVPTATLR